MTTLNDDNLAQAVSPLAALLRDYMRQNNLSMYALARKAGCNAKAVSSIVSGRVIQPNRLTLERLARATDIPLDDLIAGTASQDPNAALFEKVRRGRFMSDALAAVEASDLSPRYKAEISGHVMRVCRWFKREPAQVPADPRWLSERLDKFLPAALGLSKKSFSNIKSSLNRALEIAAAKPKARAPIQSVSSVWWALYEAIPDRPVIDRRTGQQKLDAFGQPKFQKSYISTALSPFIRYCDQRGIVPEAVNDASVEEYSAFRDSIDLEGGLGEKISKVRTAWNKASRTIPGWPATRLRAGLVRSPDLVVRPASDFPESLQAELITYQQTRGLLALKDMPNASRIERLRARVAATADGPGYKRQKVLGPLSERVASEHTWAVRFFASAMIRLGAAAPEDFQCIADVANIKVAIDVMEEVKERVGWNSSYAGEQVKKLASVARRWDPEIGSVELDGFSELRSIVEEKIDKGVMPARDRERLAPFLNDTENMALLVSLPIWIIEEAERRRKRTGRVDADMARAVQGAIAMLIEQTLPVRWIDLRRTKIEENVIWPLKDGQPGTLHYRPSKTRGAGQGEAKAVQAKLEPWKMRLLTIYRRHYLPLFPGGATSPYLFPGDKPDSCKCHQALSRLVGGLVEELLGFKVHPHLWRKLMGGFLLAQTRDLRLVELLLGHSPNSPATKVYVELQTAWAAAELDKRVSRLVDGSKRPKHIRMPWERR